MDNDEYLLKWDNHQSNLLGVFEEWRRDESFVDVTLVCDGESLSGHKVVLAACSPLLDKILRDNPCKHPVIILNDVSSSEMKALLKFIYQGEVSVSENEFASFLQTADDLQIKGLAQDKDILTKKWNERDANFGGSPNSKRRRKDLKIHSKTTAQDSILSSCPNAEKRCSSSSVRKSSTSSSQSTVDTEISDIHKHLVVKLEPLDDSEELIFPDGNIHVKKESINQDDSITSSYLNAGGSSNASAEQTHSNPPIFNPPEPFERLGIASDFLQNNVATDSDVESVNGQLKMKFEDATEFTCSCQSGNYATKTLRKPRKPRKVTLKRPWSQDEISEVEKYFHKFIYETKKLPGKAAITIVLNKNSTLRKRTWRHIKDHIRLRILRVNRTDVKMEVK